ncbi:MAG: enoyl-CoA hydratase/isomerase family protein [Deltaproteobacteria bacterium]|nr:enoyl-CoA hydratase/isomerase family protein [Deltaproteobacteria bacterium]MBI3390017.1 enoyl-CoA hydratase/isomerase family protein [Deltaproteobacteria bacterium]
MTIRARDLDGGVRILTLDRPPANAIDETLLHDLDVALDAAASDDTRAVVLTGAGSFFSGGFDFSAPRRDDEVATDLYRLYRDTHRKLLMLPKPTIAMMNGHAIAGGLVLVLACDYRLGAEGDYRVGLNEVAVGASFPKAAFEIVRLRLAHARATELILGAALYPASQALRLGVVDELFPRETFEETVLKRATRLAGFPREAYAHAKAAFVAETAALMAAETDEEALRTMSVWITPESRAARKKQRDKLGVRA